MTDDEKLQAYIELRQRFRNYVMFEHAPNGNISGVRILGRESTMDGNAELAYEKTLQLFERMGAFGYDEQPIWCGVILTPKFPELDLPDRPMYSTYSSSSSK